MNQTELLAQKRVSRRQDIIRRLEDKQADAFLVQSRENTQYLTGFTGTTSLALITSQASYILLDSRYIEQGTAQCTDMTAVPVRNPSAGLPDLIKEQKIRRLAIEDEEMSYAGYRRLVESLPGVDFIPFSAEASNVRVVKDEVELATLREAVRISDEAWTDLVPTIKIGMTENEVAARLEYFFRLKGASGPSFETIIASGHRSAMPHGVASDKKIEAGDPIVMDFGCLYEGYCSDCTRTIFVDHIKPEIGKIYDVVLAAQQKAEQTIKAGMIGRDCHQIAADVINEAGYGDYFGHGLGHSVGLLIHESPNFSLSESGPIPAGAVLSVEPGIYLPGKGGVRIEDIGLVTDEGYESFTQITREKTLISGKGV